MPTNDELIERFLSQPANQYPDLHWLSGWANRIEALISNDEWTPSKLDTMVFMPCQLARQEMLRYSVKYPEVIRLVKDALQHAEKCHGEHVKLLPLDACQFCGKMGDMLDEDPPGYLYCHSCGQREKLVSNPPHQVVMAEEYASEAYIHLMKVIREAVETIEQAESAPDEFVPISKGELMGLLKMGKTAFRTWLDDHPNDIREERRTAKNIKVRKSILDNLRGANPA